MVSIPVVCALRTASRITLDTCSLYSSFVNDVYSSLLPFRYGLRKVALSKMEQFLRGIVKYAPTDRRCHWFGVLCGVVLPDVGGYLEVGIDVALAFIRRVIPQNTIAERLNVVGSQKANPVGVIEACQVRTFV